MSIVPPAEVAVGDQVQHLVNAKGKPVGGVNGYAHRGPVTGIRPVTHCPYGGPATHLTFADNHEAGPFLPTDRFLIANR